MIPQLLSKAKAEEVITVSNSVIVLTQKSTFQNDDLTEAVKRLEVPKEELVKIIKRKKSSDKTEIVDNYEAMRDQGLKWLFNTVYGGTFSLDETFEEHANRLYEVFTRHGLTMHRLPRKQQTAVMASMFEELKSALLQESIQVVGVGHIIDKTKEMNQLYLDSEEDRRHDNASRKILRQQNKASKDTLHELEQVVNYLNFISNIRTTEDIDMLCKEVSELISKTNTAIRARNNKGKKDNETE
jgi:hypothetical protein